MIDKTKCVKCGIRDGQLRKVRVADLDGFPMCLDCSGVHILVNMLERSKKQVDMVTEAYERELTNLRLKIKQLKKNGKKKKTNA